MSYARPSSKIFKGDYEARFGNMPQTGAAVLCKWADAIDNGWWVPVLDYCAEAGHTIMNKPLLPALTAALVAVQNDSYRRRSLAQQGDEPPCAACDNTGHVDVVVGLTDNRRHVIMSDITPAESYSVEFMACSCASGCRWNDRPETPGIGHANRKKVIDSGMWWATRNRPAHNRHGYQTPYHYIDVKRGMATKEEPRQQATQGKSATARVTPSWLREMISRDDSDIVHNE
jgi:hypothetical protein